MSVIKIKQKRLEAQIFTASMADIVFVLISFFLLTFKVPIDRTVVELPVTSIRQEIPPEASLIAIDSNGVRKVSNGREMSHEARTLDEFESFVYDRIAENPQTQFIVKADQETQYKHVDEVIDTLKQAKAQVIFILSAPVEG